MNVGLTFVTTVGCALCCSCDCRMKDVKGVDRGACMKPACACDEYVKERDFNLCSYCEHTPLSHGKLVQFVHVLC